MTQEGLHGKQSCAQQGSRHASSWQCHLEHRASPFGETNTRSLLAPVMFVFHYMSECRVSSPEYPAMILGFEVHLEVQMPPEGNGKEHYLPKHGVCPSCRWLCT